LVLIHLNSDILLDESKQIPSAFVTRNEKNVLLFIRWEEQQILIYISVNLLKPTGHVMHHQFNIQQLYALPTLYLCIFYLSENKQRLVPLTA